MSTAIVTSLTVTDCDGDEITFDTYVGSPDTDYEDVVVQVAGVYLNREDARLVAEFLLGEAEVDE